MRKSVDNRDVRRTRNNRDGDRDLSNKHTAENDATTGKASALETLCWMRERLCAGEDEAIVQMLRQTSMDAAEQAGAAMRNSIEHQTCKIGQATYHIHLFSFPVLAAAMGPFDPASTTVKSILPSLLQTMRDYGLAEANGMLAGRLVSQATLVAMEPSELYGLGQELFAMSVAGRAERAALGAITGRSERLAKLEHEVSVDLEDGGEADSLYCGHLVGCLYSRQPEHTRLDGFQFGLVAQRLNALLEFAMSGSSPVTVRVGAPESLLAAVQTAAVFYAEEAARHAIATTHGGGEPATLSVSVEDGAVPLERMVRIEAHESETRLVTAGMALSVYEAQALERIVAAVERQACDANLVSPTVTYAAGQTRH